MINFACIQFFGGSSSKAAARNHANGHGFGAPCSERACFTRLLSAGSAVCIYSTMHCTFSPSFSLLPPPHSMSLTQLSLPFLPNCLSRIFLYLRARLSCETTHSYVARLVHSHLSLYSAALYVCGCPRIQRLPTATATETYVIHMCHLCSVHFHFSHNVFCY